MPNLRSPSPDGPLVFRASTTDPLFSGKWLDLIACFTGMVPSGECQANLARSWGAAKEVFANHGALAESGAAA